MSILSLADPISVHMEKTLREAFRHYFVDKSQLNGLDRLLGYFGLEEPHICAIAQRTAVSTGLLPSDLRDIPSLFCLEAEDKVCPSHTVRMMCQADASRRRPTEAPIHLMWVDGAPHGAFLLWSRVMRDLVGALKNIHTTGQIWRQNSGRGKQGCT